MKNIFLVLTLTITSAIVADTVVVPNTLSNGTVADADDVNANFAALADGINAIKSHVGAAYRWQIFSTRIRTSLNSGVKYLANNDAALHGGILPSNWSSGNGVAAGMSLDMEVLRALYTRKGYAGSNALIVSDVHTKSTSGNRDIASVLFRIKNSTSSPIVWVASWIPTSNSASFASAALNGVSVWDSSSGGYNGTITIQKNISIPANSTNTVIFTSGTFDGSYDTALFLAFNNNSLMLPTGLKFVDDLDVAVSLNEGG